MCLVTWPMNASEAGSDLTLIQTSMLFSFNCQLVSIRNFDLHNKSREDFIDTRSPVASLPFKGQVTKQTTVKWFILFSPTLNTRFPAIITKRYYILYFSISYYFHYSSRHYLRTFGRIVLPMVTAHVIHTSRHN